VATAVAVSVFLAARRHKRAIRKILPPALSSLRNDHCCIGTAMALMTQKNFLETVRPEEGEHGVERILVHLHDWRINRLTLNQVQNRLSARKLMADTIEQLIKPTMISLCRNLDEAYPALPNTG
jgi:hypothetical protein